MKTLYFMFSFVLLTSLFADDNKTKDQNKTMQVNSKKKINQQSDSNKTRSKQTLEQQIEEQIKREKKYAEEMKFYQGDEYDLKAAEIDEKSLDRIPTIEPEDDFDMTDVYRDDI